MSKDFDLFLFNVSFLGPMNSYLTSGKQDNDNVEFDPLVNVPELPKSRTSQSTTSTIPHWFDISSGGVGLTARSNGTITVWDLNNGKFFLRFSSRSISFLFSKGEVRRKLRGHTEDVYISRFFPSGKEKLTIGSEPSANLFFRFRCGFRWC